MTTLTAASHQWATRPRDERFTNLLDLLAHTRGQRDISDSRVVSSRAIRAVPVEGDGQALALQERDGRVLLPSHWAFGQIAARADSPAKYLRSLHPTIAADCINYKLRARDVDEIGLLSRDDLGGSAHSLAAATGPAYGRIFNADVVAQLVDRFGDGVTGDWRIPGEFGRAVTPTIENTTLYAGDRDMFVFLADETNRVDLGGRDALARGFFVWNSEVGSATLGIGTFLFRYACTNRIVWGAEGYKEFRIRHTAGAPDRFIEEVAPALKSYAESSTLSIETAITAAKAARLDDVDDFLAKRFTAGQTRGIKLAHESDEGRPIETIWDAVNGITAYARGIEWQDARVGFEREAGKVLKIAA